jgi:hypothetical protein
MQTKGFPAVQVKADDSTLDAVASMAYPALVTVTAITQTR